MKTLLALAALLYCALPFAHAGAPSQDPGDEAPAAWPDPSGDEKASIKLEVVKLRKARTPEMAETARAALEDLGPVAVPALLKVYAKERDAETLERMHSILVAITGPEHTRAWAGEFGHKSGSVRTLALLRAAAYPNPSVREDAEAALKAAMEARKPDADERYAAALACASAGSLQGLELLFEQTKSDYAAHARELGVALAAVRGDAATAAVRGLLTEQRDDRLAALRLLAGCGSPAKATTLVRPFLDNDDNALRIAAINALRGIVDGDPPLERLSVFEAIERANKWKERL